MNVMVCSTDLDLTRLPLQPSKPSRCPDKREGLPKLLRGWPWPQRPASHLWMRAFGSWVSWVVRMSSGGGGKLEGWPGVFIGGTLEGWPRLGWVLRISWNRLPPSCGWPKLPMPLPMPLPHVGGTG